MISYKVRTKPLNQPDGIVREYYKFNSLYSASLMSKNLFLEFGQTHDVYITQVLKPSEMDIEVELKHFNYDGTERKNLIEERRIS